MRNESPARDLRSRCSANACRNRGSRAAVAAGVTISGALGILAPCGAFAADGVAPMDLPNAPSREWAVSVRWENDTFGGTDKFYTDGVALGVTHTGPSWLDPLADWLPWGGGRRTVGYDVTQGMFTPADTTRVVPDPKDRPYAGVLAFGFTLHVEQENSYHGLKFVVGVVGPWSLAEEAQNAVHDLIGNDKSQGWDHQLRNEPVFNLAYEHRHRFHLAGEREQWAVQASPIAGGWLGNLLIQG
jgi:lipid A 3-O-deacylase